MSNQENLNDSQEMIQLGQKLALFISAMPIDDEAKAEMVRAALLMNETELAEFVTALEVKYADIKTQHVDEELKQGLAGIKEKYAAERKTLNDETLAAMADLENELDSL